MFGSVRGGDGSRMESRRVVLESWRRLLDTPFGLYLMERTGLVRRLSDRDDGSPSVLAAPLLAGAGVCLLLAALCGLSGVFLWVPFLALALGFLAVLAWVPVFWAAYRFSTQRTADSLNTREGLMRRDMAEDLYGPQAAARTARLVAPEHVAWVERSHGRVDPDLGGMLLGTCRGAEVFLSREIPALIVGPARSGKTTGLVANLIMEAPGACVATSTRKDILDMTLDARRASMVDPARPGRRFGGGRVWVFDPMGVCRDNRYAHTLWWSPVVGCEDPHVARVRASAIVAQSGIGDDGRNGIWAQSSGGIVQAMLYAAAVDHRTVRDVYRWTRSPQAAQEVVQILRSVPGVDPTDWAATIDVLQREDPRTTSSKWLSVMTGFDALGEPAVMERLDVRDDDPRLFDMRAFLTGTVPMSDGSYAPVDRWGRVMRPDGEGNVPWEGRSRDTVYLMCELDAGDGSGPSGVGGFVAMFLTTLLTEARKVASSTRRGRLEPPCTLVLDEIMNMAKWPELPQAVAAGSGDGVQTWIVEQSTSQGEARYGRQTADNMLDSCALVLLGGAKGQLAQDLSRMSGTSRVRRTETQRTGLFEKATASTRTDDRPVLTPDDVRELPARMALLMDGRKRLAAVNLRTYMDRGWSDRRAALAALCDYAEKVAPVDEATKAALAKARATLADGDASTDDIDGARRLLGLAVDEALSWREG